MSAGDAEIARPARSGTICLHGSKPTANFPFEKAVEPGRFDSPPLKWGQPAKRVGPDFQRGHLESDPAGPRFPGHDAIQVYRVVATEDRQLHVGFRLTGPRTRGSRPKLNAYGGWMAMDRRRKATG
jgi:hypothetical protein